MEADYAEPYVCKVGPFQTQRNYLSDKTKVEVHCINVYAYKTTNSDAGTEICKRIRCESTFNFYKTEENKKSPEAVKAGIYYNVFSRFYEIIII